MRRAGVAVSFLLVLLLAFLPGEGGTTTIVAPRPELVPARADYVLGSCLPYVVLAGSRRVAFDPALRLGDGGGDDRGPYRGGLGAAPHPAALVAMDGDQVTLWHPETGAEIARLNVLSGGYQDSEVSPDWTRLFVSVRGRGFELWDIARGVRLAAGDAPNANTNFAAKFSPDSQRMSLIETFDERYRRLPSPGVGSLYEARTGARLADFAGAGVDGFLLQGQRVLTEPFGQEPAALWNAADGALIARFDGGGLRVLADETRILDEDGGWRLWDVGADARLAEGNGDIRFLFNPRNAGSHDLFIESAWGEGNEHEIVWDARTGQRRAVLGPAGLDWLAAPDARALVTIDEAGRAVLWNLELGEELGPVGQLYADAEITGAPASEIEDNFGSYFVLRESGRPLPVQILFSRLGDRVAVRERTGDVAVWNTSTGERLSGIGRFDETVELRFSRQGRWLVAFEHDEPARVWDAVSGRRVAQLGPANASADFTFAFDERRLIFHNWAAPPYAEASLWDVATGRKLADLPGVRPGHPALLSPDGRYAVLSAADVVNGFHLRLWDLARGRDLGVIGGEEYYPEFIINRDRTWLQLERLGRDSLGYARQQLIVFDPRNGHEMGRCDDAIRVLIYETPSGVRLAAPNAEGEMWLWRPR